MRQHTRHRGDEEKHLGFRVSGFIVKAREIQGASTTVLTTPHTNDRYRKQQIEEI
jgi:hypothetical protein